MSHKITWPEGRQFAFTIVDDTDFSVVENTAPVYQLLKECGMRTTKTVWVYPPRDHIAGDCLQDRDYLTFIRQLKRDGFEIALHGVGSGAFSRDEIIEGLRFFKEALGDYPTMHINHSMNPDNLYSGYKRFVFPLRHLMKRLRRDTFYGDERDSPYFWGDCAQKHIRYARNHVINGINTLAFDPRMPYPMKGRAPGPNNWFSSSDGSTAERCNQLLCDRNIGRLERSAGCCIVYTHFAKGFVKDGQLDATFEIAIRNLAARNGWFAPAGEVLDHLAGQKTNSGPSSYAYLLGLDLKLTVDRISKKVRSRG